MIFIADADELRFFMISEDVGHAREIMRIVPTDLGHQVELKVFSGWTMVDSGSLERCQRYVRQRLFGVDDA